MVPRRFKPNVKLSAWLLLAGLVFIALGIQVQATHITRVPATLLRTGDITSDMILNATIVNADIAADTIQLGTTTVGVLPVAEGGTNTSTALSNNRLMFSSGGAIAEAGALTNGQLFIGSTSAAPVAAALTAGSNITITNGAGSITIAASAGFAVASTSQAQDAWTAADDNEVNFTGLSIATSTPVLIRYSVSKDSTAGATTCSASIAVNGQRLFDATNLIAAQTGAVGWAVEAFIPPRETNFLNSWYFHFRGNNGTTFVNSGLSSGTSTPNATITTIGIHGGGSNDNDCQSAHHTIYTLPISP